jgi:hypothetical protein
MEHVKAVCICPDRLVHGTRYWNMSHYLVVVDHGRQKPATTNPIVDGSHRKHQLTKDDLQICRRLYGSHSPGKFEVL